MWIEVGIYLSVWDVVSFIYDPEVIYEYPASLQYEHMLLPNQSSLI